MPRKPELTIKQAKYIGNRIAGKNKKQSMLDAGYSPGSATGSPERKPLVQQTLKEALIQVGVDGSYMAKHLKKGLNVRKESFTSDKTIKDNDVRQRYAQLVMRARGDIDGESSTQVNLGIIEVPQMKVQDVNEWNSQVENQSDEQR